MQNNLQAIIMAAGKSSRFKTNRSKLLEKICGQEMILYNTKLLEKLKISTSVIVGYQKDEVKNCITKQHGNKINFVEQAEQKGTAHALLCSKELWEYNHLLIMNADMPLVSQSLIQNLWQQHLNSNAAVSFVAAHNLDPALDSYGKVMQTNDQIKIIEAKDYQALIAQDPTQQSESCCINAGIYIFKKSFLEQTITQLQTSSVTGEFYITDLIEIASQKKLGVELLIAPVDQIRGINTLRELWIAEQIKQAEIINYWMQQGVRFQAAQNSYIDLNVTIGAGTFIGQGVQITGNSDIAENCYLEPFTLINHSTIGKESLIKAFCYINNVNLNPNSTIEAYTNLSHDLVLNANQPINKPANTPNNASKNIL